MNRCGTLGGVAGMLFLNALFVPPIYVLAAEGTDAESVFQVLDAGVEKWRFGVEFRCHYKYRQGTASSRDEALRGEFGAAAGKPGDENTATGVFHKRGGQLRLSVDYGRPPDDATGRGTGEVVTNCSFDEVSSPQLYLQYIPKYGKVGNSVNVWKRPERESGKLQAGPSMGAVLDPFVFGGGVTGSPLTAFAPRPAFQETVRRSLEKMDSDHIVAVMIRTGKGGNMDTRRVAFWTAHSPPVIERIEEVAQVANGQQRVETLTQGSRFVQCGGGMMARCVRRLAGPLLPRGGSRPVWVSEEWISDDLGERMPTDEDFAVTIPPSVAVSGLKKPPPVGSARTLELAKYTIDDLITNFSAPVDLTAKPADEGARSGWREALPWLIAAVLVILVAAVGSRWRRSVRTVKMPSYGKEP